MATKKSVEELRENKIINQAKREVPGFGELLHRFERTVSVLGRSQSTFQNYSRHVAAWCRYISEKFLQNWIPEQIHDYLFTFRKNQNHLHSRILKHRLRTSISA